MSYSHLTQEARIELAALLRAGLKQSAIARELQVDPSTISREVSRNSDPVTGKYHAGGAKRKTRQRRKEANQRFLRIEQDAWLRTYIIKKLKTQWSPEQIAGRLRKEKGYTLVCTETIYAWMYRCRPDLKVYLRCKKGKYRRKGTKKREKQRKEKEKKRIDERPEDIEKRKDIGHWEGDTIVGGEKTAHILTHAERKSRYLLADTVPHATAKKVREITTTRFNRLPKKKRKTITYDNGLTFAEHEQLEQDTGIDIYFAYPYHSWERGTNEHTNGLLRQFFPKGTLFADITQQELDRIVRLINTRPRKCLNYATPSEVFFGHVAL